MAPTAGEATTDASGAWRVELPPMDAGGPYRLTANGAGGAAAVEWDITTCSPDELDARQGLRDVGLDSLMALELRNRVFANALKVFRGWPGEVFDKRSANWVELRSPESIVQQIAYTIVNCVAAGAVQEAMNVALGMVEPPGAGPSIRAAEDRLHVFDADAEQGREVAQFALHFGQGEPPTIHTGRATPAGARWQPPAEQHVRAQIAQWVALPGQRLEAAVRAEGVVIPRIGFDEFAIQSGSLGGL